MYKVEPHSSLKLIFKLISGTPPCKAQFNKAKANRVDWTKKYKPAATSAPGLELWLVLLVRIQVPHISRSYEGNIDDLSICLL